MGQRVSNGELEFLPKDNKVITLNKNLGRFKTSNQANILRNAGVNVQIWGRHTHRDRDVERE